jgi:hypothetical protein
MLEHFFWLLEFKFKFEFHCLNPFLKPLFKISETFPFTPKPPILSGPNIASGPSVGSPPVPLFLFSPAPAPA